MPWPEIERRPLRILRDIQAGGLLLFQAGEVIQPGFSCVRRITAAPWGSGFRGWLVRRSTTDPTEHILEEGVDAVAVEEDEPQRAGSPS